MSDLKAFARLVKTMREQQKGFFAARRVGNKPAADEYLRASKELEKQVDADTERILDNQTTLLWIFTA